MLIPGNFNRRAAHFICVMIKTIGMAALMLGLVGCGLGQPNPGGKSRVPETSSGPTSTPVAAENTKDTPALPSGSLPQPIATPTVALRLVLPTDNPTTVIPTLVPKTGGRVVPTLDPGCLIGNWQVSDLTGAMQNSYAQTAMSSLRLDKVEGETLYTFDANGNMTIAFNHLAATFSGQMDNRDITALQALDGSGSARYQVDQASSQIVLSDFGGEGVVSTLDINGQRLAEGNLPVWGAFTNSLSNDTHPESALVKYSRASVTCAGDTMTIQAVEPVAGPDINLTRVK